MLSNNECRLILAELILSEILIILLILPKSIIQQDLYIYIECQIIVIKKYMNRVNSISQYQAKSNYQPHRVTAFSQSTATPMSNSSQISNIIQCLLCSESIRQSHMCPSCCKLFCESCIKNWIKNKKGQCPSCLKPLNHSNLLNCSILGRQIEQALSKSVNKIRNPHLNSSNIMSPPGIKVMFPKCQTPHYQSPNASRMIEALCDKHQLRLDYFCEQCCVSLCSDCAVLLTNHQGHRICKFSQKKAKFKQVILGLQKSIMMCKSGIEKGRNQLNDKKQKVISGELQKQKSFNLYIDSAFQKNMQKYCKIIVTREQMFFKMYNYFENVSKYFLTSYNQIQQFSKPQLIRNSQKVNKQIVDFMAKNQQYEVVPAQRMKCLIVPDFQQKTFILENYNYLRQKGQILLSEPLFTKGTQWRLKIYPGGVNYKTRKGLEEYLAIHLQMSKGPEQPNWYRYRIELVNQANRSKCMSFEFENDFKQGSEWRLDNFIQISTLYSDNFINKEQGFIEIVLYVRCLSYYHAVEQQNKLVVQKEAQINKNYCHLLKLHKKAAQLGIKMENHKTSSPPAQCSNSSKSPHSNKGQSKRLIAIDQNQ